MAILASSEAVARAARDFGTSVSASRLTAGERMAHRELEQRLAAIYEAEDAIAFVSGHATAVSTIASLLEQRDLIVHDSLIHNCVVAGARMSGATRRFFEHNDLDALEALLRSERHRFNRALIATEGPVLDGRRWPRPRPSRRDQGSALAAGC